MKKFLLSIFAILGLGLAANAETYTYVMGDVFSEKVDPLTTWTMGGFTFTPDKAEGNNAPAYIATGKDVRLYKGNKLTISCSVDITSISFELSAQGLKRYAELTASTGTFAEMGANPLVWNGSAKSVEFTVGDNKYGTEEGKAGQFDFVSVTITTNGDAGTADPVNPGDDEKYGKYKKVTTIANGSYLFYASDSIAQPIASNKTYGYLYTTKAEDKDGVITTEKTNAFTITAVEGGYTIQDDSQRYYIMTGTYNSFNLSAERTDGDLWTIEPQADGTMLITNVLMNKWVQYSHTYNSFGSYPEATDDRELPTLYLFDGNSTVEPPVDPRTSITTLADVYNQPKGEKVTIDLDLTTVYTSGAYTYVYDGSKYALIYGSDLGVKAGDVIAKGWNASIDIYSNLYEIKPESTVTVSGTADIPAPVELYDDEVATALVPSNQNTYVLLHSVTFAAATPAADAATTDERTFVGTMGDTELSFYQRFGIESKEAGTYDVIGFISVFKENVQIYPTEINVPGGINGIESDANGAVYYNIQGVKVDNPRQGGLYIRVMGGKAMKVAM